MGQWAREPHVWHCGVNRFDVHGVTWTCFHTVDGCSVMTCKSSYSSTISLTSHWGVTKLSSLKLPGKVCGHFHPFAALSLCIVTRDVWYVQDDRGDGEEFSGWGELHAVVQLLPVSEESGFSLVGCLKGRPLHGVHEHVHPLRGQTPRWGEWVCGSESYSLQMFLLQRLWEHVLDRMVSDL